MATTNKFNIEVVCNYLDLVHNKVEDKKHEGSFIEWDTIQMLEKKSKCKIQATLKMDLEAFYKLNIEEFDKVIAVLEFNFGEKALTCKCLEIKKQ